MLVKDSNKKERKNNEGDDYAKKTTSNDVLPSLLYTNIFRPDKEEDPILAETPSVATPHLPPPPAKASYGKPRIVDEKRVELKPLKTGGAAKRIAKEKSTPSQGQESRKEEVKVPLKKIKARGFMSFWDILKSRQS